MMPRDRYTFFSPPRRVANGEPRCTRRARTPARKADFSSWEGKIPRDVDSPLEGTGFEPSVPGHL